MYLNVRWIYQSHGSYGLVLALLYDYWFFFAPKVLQSSTEVAKCIAAFGSHEFAENLWFPT